MPTTLILLGALPTLLVAAPPDPETPADPAPPATAYFEIRVVDEQTGRGVPLVELRTVNDIRRFTDSAGRVAFHEPGLMDRTVFFHLASHGYEFPADGFGYRGRKLQVTPGGHVTLKIKRLLAAERLYRVTGAGIYRDTRLLGLTAPLDNPLLNAGVFGSDSVCNAVFRDRIYWFWGDTNRPSYPLGNFHVPGAVSELPASGLSGSQPPGRVGLDPAVGVDLDYFEGPDGFARPTARMPGDGPTWLGGLTVLPAESVRERMLASYVKIKPPMEVYQRGIVEFDAERNTFEKRREWDLDLPLFPHGHPFLHSDEGTKFVYFATPYPLVRVPADPAAFLDPRRYETYTYVRTGGRADDAEVDRDDRGRLRFAWRPNTVPLSAKLERQLIESGSLREDEAWIQLRDVDTDKTVRMHGGSVYWNAYRERWIMIGVESFGTSFLGEVWYAESEAPEGPWRRGKKIVTHDKYSFYNPKQHPMFDQRGGRIIYFEGTYTNTFSGNSERTPRYNYNQIMYRLDLDHPALAAVRGATN